MLNIYKTKERDWMGYKIYRNTPLTRHHIFKKVYGGDNNISNYALLIESARRIGKSTIVERFAEENYKSYVIIDFAIASKDIKDNFKDNLNKLDVFFQNISLEYNKKIISW